MGGTWALIVELALLGMKIFGVSAQKQKNFLDWVAKKAADSKGSVQMKDSWKEQQERLIKLIEEKKKAQIQHPIQKP